MRSVDAMQTSSHYRLNEMTRLTCIVNADNKLAKYYKADRSTRSAGVHC